MNEDNAGQTVKFDNAIKVLVKLIKTIGFYPPGHPALTGSLDETLSAFRSLLGAGENLACLVRRDHLVLEGTASKATNQAAQKLAAFFFSRRIHRLTLHAEISSRDLQGFARALGMDADEIKRQGGIAGALRTLQVTGISVQELEAPQLGGGNTEEGHLGASIEEPGATATAAQSSAAQDTSSAAKSLVHGGDDEAPAEGSEERDGSLSGANSSTAQQDLHKLLTEVEREKVDERYRFLLQELIPRLRESLVEENAPLVFRALMLLAVGATDQRSSPVRRGASREALKELQGTSLFDLLIDDLRPRGHRPEHRKNIYRLLTFFGTDAAQRLMVHLVAEEDAAARKYLSEAIIHQGRAAVPVLIPYLVDNRWYVVRNAVAVLGEIRDQSSAHHLAPLLSHDDLRVRRESVRALTRIGGDQAAAVLLQMAVSNDFDLCRQAILSLGALRHQAAIPTLLEIVRRPDPFLRRVEITREAIWALGEISDPAAVPDLIALLQRRQFWNGRHFAEIRAAAALALGEIGAEKAAEALTRAIQDRHPVVSRAAVQALRRVRKEEQNGSTRTHKDRTGLVRGA